MVSMIKAPRKVMLLVPAGPIVLQEKKLFEEALYFVNE
jgi:hypothetical protein